MIYIKRLILILFLLGTFLPSFVFSQESISAPAGYTKDLIETVLYEDVTSLRDRAQSLIARNDELEAEHQALLNDMLALKSAMEDAQAEAKKPLKIKRTPMKKPKKKVKPSQELTVKSSDVIKADIEELKKQLLEMKVTEETLEKETAKLKIDLNILTSEVDIFKKPSKSDQKETDASAVSVSGAALDSSSENPKPIVYSQKDVASAKKEIDKLEQEQKKLLEMIKKNQKKVDIANSVKAKNFQLSQDVVARRQAQKAALEADNQRLEAQIQTMETSLENLKVTIADRQKKNELLGVGEIDPLLSEGKDLRAKTSELKNAIDALNRETAMIQDLLEIKRKHKKDFMTQ